MARYLVTGAAGFIGSHISEALLQRGDQVTGIDNMNCYYSPILKQDRINRLKHHKQFYFRKIDLIDYEKFEELFAEQKFHKVCHLAAQAGVRYSIQNPFAYQQSNLEGFLNVLELCRNFQVENLVYASSSSVYGGNERIPFNVKDKTDYPISLYAATKRSNELMAYSYHHLYGLNCAGLRFFTVYGPWGRPDMALFKFTRAILANEEIEVYNYGKMKRDFTYINDIVAGVLAALDNNYQYEIFNLGNSQVVELSYFISCIEKSLGIKARQKLLPMQAGDIEATWADIAYSTEKLDYVPRVSIEEGIDRFVEWYRAYYGS